MTVAFVGLVGFAPAGTGVPQPASVIDPKSKSLPQTFARNISHLSQKALFNTGPEPFITTPDVGSRILRITPLFGQGPLVCVHYIDVVREAGSTPHEPGQTVRRSQRRTGTRIVSLGHAAVAVQ